jgi:hypothetical protein
VLELDWGGHVHATRGAGNAGDRDGRQRILFIGGLGRSGSTLLALLLNSLPAFVYVGELRMVWHYQQHDLLCSCGEPFHGCEFWRAVGAHAFGGWDQADVPQVVQAMEFVDRHRYLPFLAKPGLSRKFDDRLRVYQEAISRIYAATRVVSGSDVVVDATKVPPFAFVVRGIDGVDLRIVHLVRDPRGVAYSWTKWKRRPEVQDAPAFMDRYGPVSASLRWLDCNVLMQSLVGSEVPGLLVKYEDFVAHPGEVVRSVVRHAGEPVQDDLIEDLLNARRTKRQNHSVAGNPIRFEQGPLRLRLDDEWKSQMRRRDRLLVTALTAPMLSRYGYRARVAG